LEGSVILVSTNNSLMTNQKWCKCYVNKCYVNKGGTYELEQWCDINIGVYLPVIIVNV